VDRFGGVYVSVFDDKLRFTAGCSFVDGVQFQGAVIERRA
jgi:hypothetical protein